MKKDPLEPHINPDGTATDYDNPIVRFFLWIDCLISRFFDKLFKF